jgi:hypothetical protein
MDDGGDLPVRLERIEGILRSLGDRIVELATEVQSIRRRVDFIWGQQGDIIPRVAWLELQHHVPMTYLEATIAEQMARERSEHWRRMHEYERRAQAAYNRAKAEADRTGSRAPFDELTRRVHAGEFDSPSSNN